MKKKKIVSMLLVMLLCMCTYFQSGAVNAETAGTSEQNPIIITTAEQLSSLANSSLYYKLGNDIDLQRVNWTPIGATNTPFKGTLDGDGYAIKNLNVTQNSDAGLFGFTSGATIKNLRIEGNSTLSGTIAIGSFVGHAKTGITLINCSSNAIINASGNQIGGLVGRTQNGGYISQCSFTGSVSGAAQTGGIIGQIFGSSVSSYIIQQCYATGTVSGSSDVGGIVGSASTTIMINQCFTTNTISGSSSLGGIIGGLTSNEGDSYIQDCYSWSNVTGTGSTGGIAGYISSTTKDVTVQRCYSLGTITTSKNTYTGGIVGIISEEYIRNCAALNPCISQYYNSKSGGYYTVARIAGKSYSNTRVSNNIGLDTTEVYVRSAKQTIPNASNSSDLNGTTVTLSQVNSKLQDSLGWDFTNIWTLEPSISEFPILRFQATVPTGITISSASETLTAGESIMLTATVIPENAANKNVIWESSDTSIALVSQDGQITAIKAGTAIITARTADGNHTAFCEITVIPKMECINVALNKNAASNSISGSNKAAYAVDGNPDTRWGAKNWDIYTPVVYLDIDLGKAYDIHTIKINEFGNRITSYALQYWDGNQYVDLTTGDKIGTDFIYDFEPVTASQVRLAVMSTSSTYGPSIYEFEVYACIEAEEEVPITGSVNLALNATATGSSTSGSNSAGKAIDGDPDTRWLALTADTEMTLTINFLQEQTFNMIKIIEVYERIGDFKIQYFDGSIWLDIVSGRCIGPDYEVSFSDITASKIRLLVENKINNQGGPSISEFETYYVTE